MTTQNPTPNSNNARKFLNPIILISLLDAALVWARDQNHISTATMIWIGVPTTLFCLVWSFLLLKRYNIGFTKKG